MSKKKKLRRQDGSKSQRGLWDNIRDNKGSGRKPTKEMLEKAKHISKESSVVYQARLQIKRAFLYLEASETATKFQVLMNGGKNAYSWFCTAGCHYPDEKGPGGVTIQKGWGSPGGTEYRVSKDKAGKPCDNCKKGTLSDGPWILIQDKWLRAPAED